MNQNTTSIKDKIIQQIRFNEDLALGALINYLGDEIKGDLAMENSKFTNIFFAFNVSQDFIDAVVGLLDDGVIELEPTELLVYLYDGGGIPDLPIAQKPMNYKKPRWLPMLVKKGKKFPSEQHILDKRKPK